MAWAAKQQGGGQAQGLMHLDDANPILLEALSTRLGKE